ncbi:MAG TPA: DUF378 domain-containing protein [Pseudoxanthomonas sp.]|nr:DUF378 domain-containing protein [Pseudoxanthomonas sp.]
MRNNFISWLAFILVVVGAINWGLVGFFAFDLVAALFGEMTAVSRIVYGLVGIAGVYLLIDRLTVRDHAHHGHTTTGTTGTHGTTRTTR